MDDVTAETQSYTPLEKPTKITEQQWPDGTVPLVSIRCITYNHVNFIRDAIEGFLMQETTFPVEILIHDDASTDGTADIVREYEAKYPQLIRPVYQTENQYSQGNKPGEFLGPLIRGKYIAVCEGDDYWISSEKLEKQVDFHIEHPRCSISFHRAEIKSYNQSYAADGVSISFGCISLFKKNYFFFEGGSTAPTCTLIYKRKILNVYPESLKKSPVGDMPLKLFSALSGRVGYLDEIWGCRRIGTPGSWNIRTRLDSDKQAEYPEGMIDMLENFKALSPNCWIKELTKRQQKYAIDLLRMKGPGELKKRRKLFLNRKIFTFNGLKIVFMITKGLGAWVVRSSPWALKNG